MDTQAQAPVIPAKPVEGQPLPQPENPQEPKKKSHKKLIIALVIVGVLFVLLILVAPALKLLNIDPEAKFVEAVVNTCSEECAQSGDSSNKCIFACLEEDNVIEQAGACDACLEAVNVNQCLLDACIPPRQ